MTTAITGLGFALPDLRLTREAVAEAWGHSAARGVAQRAVPAFDEDVVTLAAEAAHRALAAAGVAGADVGFIALATGGATGAPAVTLSEIVAARGARAVHLTGRHAVGADALLAAYRDAAATGRPALAVAADVPRAAPGDAAEHGEGAAAVAFVVIAGAAGVTLEADGAASSDLPGAPTLDDAGFTRSPEVTVADPDLLPRAARGVLPEGARPDFVIAHPARATLPDAAGKAVTAARETAGALRVIGDAGAAALGLDLAIALADATPGTEGVLAVADDAGAARVLRLAVHARPAGDAGVEAAATGAGRTVSYLRALQERRVLAPFADVPDAPMGAYVSLPDFARSLPQRYRLEGQRCAACDHVQFPAKPACGACGHASLAPVALSGRGTIHAATTIGRGGAPSEFALEQAMTGAYGSAVVELEEGPRIAARLTGFEEGAAKAGVPVRAVIRRLYAQQGVVRYGFKFRPGAE